MAPSDEFARLVEMLKKECMDKLERNKPNFGRKLFCNGTAGRMGTCWNHTLAGETAQGHLPSIMDIRSLDPITYRCMENGTWDSNGENFTSRGLVDTEKAAYGYGHVYVFIAGNALSIVLLTIALVIFFGFRQLRCGRVLIHKNLFLSYVFTGMTWIMYNKLAILDGDVLLTNPWWCQVLHVLAQYFMLCNFAWMFCEGLYLHTVLIRVFSNTRTLTVLCYVIGWVYPLVPTIIYTVLRRSEDAASNRCWYEESSLQWIMYGPIVVSIFVNFVFLVNIVRLLMTKLQTIPEASQSKKAARATLLLIPLLGLQYLILPIRPEPDSDYEDTYLYSIAVLTSLQGSFVSIFYCFCNGEIISIVRRKWEQHWLMYGSSRRKHRCSSTHYTVTENMADADCPKKYLEKPEIVPLQDKACAV